MKTIERAALINAINAIPHHWMGGYECEWECENWRDDDRFEVCPGWPNSPEDHGHELISRERVLALLEVEVSADRVQIAPAESVAMLNRRAKG